MRLVPLLSLVATVPVTASTTPPQHLFANPPPGSDAQKSLDHRIPTSYESAVLGRRILALTPLGTVATVFPPSTSSGDDEDEVEGLPSGIGGMPHALMEYVADCEDDGNPTFLAINIASTFRNVRAGSNISLAQAWTPRYPPSKRISSSSSSSNILTRFLSWLNPKHGQEEEENETPQTSYSAANLPRYSLLGHIEKISPSSSSSHTKIAQCFTARHPDARHWLPGNPIHASEFVRLVVEKVYWIGGFGDRAYIGWIPVHEWRNVTREEWQAVELPGEREGWEEWSFPSSLEREEEGGDL
ncbi:pyridoxamine 5'-phosphate oxidase-domain-containing protein [Xylariaceae sp. FL0594]|nr:pyridoxamine 5'-phosphate oxidase-domain-containing protein [Xylariaceae sp. FL0594]